MLSRATFHRRIAADLCEIEAIENEIHDDDALAMEEGTSSSCITAEPYQFQSFVCDDPARAMSKYNMSSISNQNIL